MGVLYKEVEVMAEALYMEVVGEEGEVAAEAQCTGVEVVNLLGEVGTNSNKLVVGDD